MTWSLWDPDRERWARVGSRAGRSLRKVAKRVMDPAAAEFARHIVEACRQIQAEDSASVAADHEPFVVGDVSNLHSALHEGRSLALADMPPRMKSMLSVGPNGRWYFDWVREFYGPLDRHIGVEAYADTPDDLPEYVTWLSADIAGEGGAAELASGSVDVVFSGQNIEHLWPDQISAFLCEANRVLTPGGLLVIDSPNRLLTAAYQWSMGEHTLELTPDEATELLRLAGFAVERMKGVWLCRWGGQLLPLEPELGGRGSHSVIRRLALATQRSDDSFIWWAEARRVGAPRPSEVGDFVKSLFEAHWDERVSRLRIFEGEPASWADGRSGVRAHKGLPCYAAMGPWMPVPSGTYDFQIDISWSHCDDPHMPVAFLEVVAGTELIERTEVNPEGAESGKKAVSCSFTLAELGFAVHARIFCTGTGDVMAPLSIDLSPAPWRTR